MTARAPRSSTTSPSGRRRRAGRGPSRIGSASTPATPRHTRCGRRVGRGRRTARRRRRRRQRLGRSRSVRRRAWPPPLRVPARRRRARPRRRRTRRSRGRPRCRRGARAPAHRRARTGGTADRAARAARRRPSGRPTCAPVTEQRSAPSAAKSTATCPAAAHASTWTRTSRSRAPATISATGCSVPTSWLASCTDTSAVSGRIASSTSAASNRPARSTPTAVTVVPGARAHASSTAECSTAVVTMWSARPPRRVPTAPQIAVFTASVPLDVNTTSRGRAPNSAATCSRALLDRDPRDATLRVQTAGIAGVLAEERQHRRRAPPGGAARTTRGRGRRRGPRQTRATQWSSPSGRLDSNRGDVSP